VGSGTRSGRIAQQSIDKVLERSDLIEIASPFTQLHKRGAEHVGRCPFHDERSPSFWVNGAKGVYHCFGCGASGDVITFLREKQGLDFVEAIEWLADRYRVDLEYEDGGPKGGGQLPRRRIYELLDAACAFYEASLHNASSAELAREYLRERGVGMDAVRAFRLGYSPEGTVLSAKAKERGFTKAELDASGLVNAGGREAFQGRLMFPIIDRASRVHGFGARQLRPDDPIKGKYVNSRKGPLFDKSHTLYVAPGLMQAARAAESVIVCEGYLDVIALWQAGIRNGCAAMGTSVTEEQVTELLRYAPRAIFALDADPAGQKATVRALEKAQAQSLDVRVVLMPEGKDPDDVIREGGAARMHELLATSVPFLEFRVNVLLGSADLADVTERDRVYNEAIELFRVTPDGPMRREQIARFGQALQLDTDGEKALFDAAGASSPMRMTRRDSWEPRRAGERAVARRVATTGAQSTAIAREKRLLSAALKFAEHAPGVDLSTLLPPDDSFSLAVHRRVRELLIEGGAPALAPARVREDEELFKLVAELSNLVQRDRLSADTSETLAQSLQELSAFVEMQSIVYRLGALKATMAGGDASEEELAEWKRLRLRRDELNPRAAERDT
jgi:DNA primase